MTQHRRPPSSASSRRLSQKVQRSTVGSHVQRPSEEKRRRNDAVEAIRRKAQLRRAVAGVVGVIIVIAAGIIAATLAFRGTVGSSIALRDSDAADALVAIEGDSPYYMLISVEHGAVAAPLDNHGPDGLLLVRVDNANQSLALISIPPNLQVSNDGKTTTLAELSSLGDAKLIEALSMFTKLDINHFVKIDEEGLSTMVEELGGLDLSLEQVIDDPQAGSVYLPAGPITLNGPTALQYLRAENLKQGRQDQISHQLTFATLLLQKIFTGNFSANIDAIGNCFQTDMDLASIEAIGAWLVDKPISEIVVTSLPGYISGITTPDSYSQERYVGSYDEFEELIAMLDRGEVPPRDTTDSIVAADPQTVTVEIQNGTTIAGAAALTAETLTAEGFTVQEVGNAEQQVYTETLVVYKDNNIDQAKAVIDSLGVGRAVNAGAYYDYKADVLVIIGSDFSPIN